MNFYNNVIASIAKLSIVTLSILLILSACTDYVKEMDEEYEEWEATQLDAEESSSSKDSGAVDSNQKSSSSAKTNNEKSSSSVRRDTVIVDPLTGDSIIVNPRDIEILSSSSSVGTDTIFVEDPPPSSSSAKVTGSSSSKKIEGTYYEDSRDGKSYRIVTLGSQTWFAENINYGTFMEERSQNEDNEVERYCLYDDPNYCDEYGGMYQWAEAMQLPFECNNKNCSELIKTPHQGICPDGWHVPSRDEWATLFTTVGGKYQAGKVLKSTSGWYENGNGIDSYGFTALPGGHGWIEGYGNHPFLAMLWTSTQSDNSDAFYASISYSEDKASLDFLEKPRAISVRCVKEALSSSEAKSSSSQGSENLSADEAKYLNAGVGGSPGYASRYWDCCKPHCAYSAQTDNLTKTCLANGNIASVNAQSVCDGGSAGVCMSQSPIVVSDKLAYAFGVVPNSNGCGKCYALTFTGEGQFKTQGNHQAIKGRTLVVMSIGPSYDVSGGEFDIMIPGGGTGTFNGCTTMGWPKNTGAQFGGLLSDCEKELDYPGDETSRQCLEDRCNSVFSDNSLSEMREGCLFLATWMMAADNPSMTYKEVECPSALINAY